MSATRPWLLAVLLTASTACLEDLSFPEDTDVDTGELVSADDQDGLVDLFSLDSSPPFPFRLGRLVCR